MKRMTAILLATAIMAGLVGALVSGMLLGGLQEAEAHTAPPKGDRRFDISSYGNKDGHGAYVVDVESGDVYKVTESGTVSKVGNVLK